MNRRAFLASLPFIPSALKAATKPKCFVIKLAPKQQFTLRSTKWSVLMPPPERHVIWMSERAIASVCPRGRRPEFFLTQ